MREEIRQLLLKGLRGADWTHAEQEALRRELCEQFVEEDLAARLHRGEVVVVRTDPDGSRWFQKAH